ncbi:hypothetical protein KIN20_027645 [Parelaphostrongylus tenuis]|uniref:Uncharacterized protein n=1 Tax=Parelaphostrongylus tenuis TaxID=148309 RepID=A0AAD5QZR3_PARTN|nr:hypothetical protein KIN20_027645 [Parelaphostrongylus tenuis]
MTFRLLAEFRAGNTNLKDELRSGYLREVGRKAVIEAAEEDPILIIEELADDLDCGHATVSTWTLSRRRHRNLLLLQDNARLHVAKLKTRKLIELS